MTNSLFEEKEKILVSERVVAYPLDAELSGEDEAGGKKKKPIKEKARKVLAENYEKAASFFAGDLARIFDDQDGLSAETTEPMLAAALRRCRYDVFSRKQAVSKGAAQPEQLIFRVRLDENDLIDCDALGANGSIQFPVIGRNIVLPYHHAVGAFFIPLDGRDKGIVLDREERRLMFYEEGNGGLKPFSSFLQENFHKDLRRPETAQLGKADKPLPQAGPRAA